MRHTIKADRMLFHNLKKCRLSLWRSSVNLISKKKLAVCSSFSVFKLILFSVVHIKACDI